VQDRVTLGRRTLLVVLQYIIGTVVGLICIMLPAKYFDVSVFGYVVGVGFASYNILAFFSDLGLKQTHMSFVQRYDFAECNSSYAMSKIILSMVSSIVFLFILLPSGISEIMLIFLLCAILFTTRDIFVGIFDSRIETMKSQSSIMMEHVTRLIFTVAFTMLAIGKPESTQALYLSLTFLLSMMASTLVTFFFIRGYPFGRPAHVKEYFSAAPAIAFMGGIDVIMLNADKLILQFFVSDSELGVYTGVNKIAQLVFYLSTALITILLPAVAARDDRGATDATSFAERYLMLIILPIAFFSIVLRNDIIRYLLPQAVFLNGSTAMILLMLATLLLAGSRSEAVLLFAKNRKREATGTNTTLAVFYVISTILFSEWYGINGAAFAALLSGLFSFSVFRYECKRIFGKPLIGGQLLRQFIAVFVSSLVLFFMGFFDAGEMTLLFFLFRIAAGIVIYVFLLILFRELGLKDLAYAMELIGGKGGDKHNRNSEK
jgi:O-antigen/teichoic acid export membrane protein